MVGQEQLPLVAVAPLLASAPSSGCRARLAVSPSCTRCTFAGVITPPRTLPGHLLRRLLQLAPPHWLGWVQHGCGVATLALVAQETAHLPALSDF